jgi:hypothetical protein
VFRGLNRFLLAGLAAGVFLVAPTGALAGGCGGNPSAVNVYKECVENGGGGTPTSGGGTPTSGGTPSSGATSVPSSSPTGQTHAGKDRRVLASLGKAYGIQRQLGAADASGAVTSPTALGSAFDLGSGPTLLLIVLSGTAVLILTGSGMRLWRRSHRSS